MRDCGRLLPDRVGHLNKSVDMGSMLSRADMDIDMDPTVIKVKRSGFEPVTGTQSLIEYDDQSTATALDAINPRLFGYRLDKGFVHINRQLARNDRESIYHHKKDDQLRKFLDNCPNQIENVDPQKASQSFIHLGGRYGELDKRTLKFTYKKPLSEVEDDYQKDRRSFFSSIIKNKGYNINNLKDIYAKKGFISKEYQTV
jgi:hypothetical protein